jgi:O-antigen/teichoic acid export membrane protein
MATRLTSIPTTMVAASVRRVFLQKAARIHNKGRRLTYAYLLLTGGLVLLGIVPLAVLWFFGEPLSTWLLGARWAHAGHYLEIISPWMFMLLVSAPANAVFVVLRKQKLWLNLQIGAAIIRLATFGVAYLMNADPEWTLGAFVITAVAGNLSIIATALFMSMRDHGSSSSEPV